ncbi:hypothetical protein E2C01_102307 [Portunus trituberculatus]|uniref:Uncharacterized protein n=1 Tax=Portunus trituberculatus TaxID=210409 RepID=A0A5B7KCU0_PORTR|nr:hypothetical protein [Portunus trituberculatus]
MEQNKKADLGVRQTQYLLVDNLSRATRGRSQFSVPPGDVSLRQPFVFGVVALFADRCHRFSAASSLVSSLLASHRLASPRLGQSCMSVSRFR